MWLYKVDFWWLLLRRWAMWPMCLWLILISYTVYFKTDESIKARFYYLWETLFPNKICKGIFWFAVIIFEISSSKGMENKRCQCLIAIKLWILSLMFFYIMAIIFEPHLQQKINIIEIKHVMTLYLSPFSNRNWKLKVNGIYHNHIILNTFLILWGSIFSRGFQILCYTLNMF